MSGLLDWVPWPKEGGQTLHNRLDVPHALRAPGWRAPRAHANATALPLLPWRVLCPAGRRAASLDVRPVGRKAKLMPKDQWSTILGQSPDVADALIQCMLLAA